ncbi:MAG: DUF6398 domain-containing protein [Planctomycetota bacterium]|jgi:hypothetical protein
MNLTFDEGKLFYDLYATLLSFANRKLKVSSEQFSDSWEYTSTPPEARVAIRDALFAQRELIDEFVAEDPAKLSSDELEIVGTWKHAVVGKFYVFRYLKRYTVFLTSGGSPNKAYGVLGLADPLKEVIGPYLPRLITTVLLPFQGKIIYDGLVSGYNITFGGGIKRMLNEEYKQAKETFGIITSLGDPAAPVPEKPKQSKKPLRKAMAGVGGRSASGEAKAIAEELVKMTDAFCREFLNEEYAELCRKLATALARKRPSPLLRGRLETWASGVVRTIGWVNFLHDPSQTPHLKLLSIDEAFGIAESTGAAKLKTIRTMFRIRQFDPKWTLPSKMDENPRVWMLEVNGFLIDIRYAPRELQEMAFEKGLIPYIPADRAEAGEEKPRE